MVQTNFPKTGKQNEGTKGSSNKSCER